MKLIDWLAKWNMSKIKINAHIIEMEPATPDMHKNWQRLVLICNQHFLAKDL